MTTKKKRKFRIDYVSDIRWDDVAKDRIGGLLCFVEHREEQDKADKKVVINLDLYDMCHLVATLQQRIKEVEASAERVHKAFQSGDRWGGESKDE